MSKTDPSTPSSAYTKMLPAWQLIDDILAGPKAIRSKGETYLPKYSSEDDTEYRRRLEAAPWRPEFDDALRSLASKPFGKDVGLAKGAPSQIKTLAEDIDARGSNLTAFLRGVFRGGITKGMHAILVDYPSMFQGATLADERVAGVRPYWVSVPANDILALYTEFVGGKEVVTHVRLWESVTKRDGFGETTVERIRVIEPGMWQLWEKKSAGWEKVSDGLMTLPQVPLALFYTGERTGPQTVKPPLSALADMQMELYRKLSRQDEIETYAGSPMLAGIGITVDADNPIQIGPKRVLFAPPMGENKSTDWKYVEPSAANLKEVRDSVRDVIQDMRRLGMQPMVRETGDVTATATSVEAAKAHSTVEAWAIALKDTAEQAFRFTSQWLGQPTGVEVEINTDFAVEPFAQSPLTALKDARASGDISHETYLSGLRRFSVLPSDLDVDEEVKAVLEEVPGDDDEDIEAAIVPANAA